MIFDVLVPGMKDLLFVFAVEHTNVAQCQSKSVIV